MTKEDRNTIMIRYNLAGIAVNLFLAVFKLIVGHLCHSHVVMPFCLLH